VLQVMANNLQLSFSSSPLIPGMVEIIRLSSPYPPDYDEVAVALPIGMNFVWHNTENTCIDVAYCRIRR
jgi:hypothetical protein